MLVKNIKKMDLNKTLSEEEGSICLDSPALERKKDKILEIANTDLMISEDSGNIPDIDEHFSRKKHKHRKKNRAMNPSSDLEDSDLYSYDELLSMLRKTESLRLIEKGQKEKTIVIPLPITARVSKVKSALINFVAICKALNREPKMFIKFIMVEFGTQASIDKNNWLILRGIYKEYHFTAVIKRFIRSYVKCVACRGFNTEIHRLKRELYVVCYYCEAKTNVEPIVDLYKALTGVPGEKRDN
ncbi:DgyrCDS5986 [Dimorphilus gyrociliatus]|uniref:Eukaryotic translation initiation factor 2 subunit 2 n=1 Tax=Dimorphilus gyrociliatus TaxID=2664684 RepID=A0A7I8VME6_9ANNE|nr:DgyrCDS5986 [Dimorphilus gyrociliatus]